MKNGPQLPGGGATKSQIPPPGGADLAVVSEPEHVETLGPRAKVVVVVLDQNVLTDRLLVAVVGQQDADVLGGTDLVVQRVPKDDAVLTTPERRLGVNELPSLDDRSVDHDGCRVAGFHSSDVVRHRIESLRVRQLDGRRVASRHWFSIPLIRTVCCVYYNIKLLFYYTF